MSEVLSIEYIKTHIIDILPIADSDLYIRQLDILIGGAINKLKNEGVHIDAKDKEGNYFFTEEEDNYQSADYMVCVAYQVLKDMDYDVDMNFMTEQYITRVNTLRCNISMKQR